VATKTLFAQERAAVKLAFDLARFSKEWKILL